MLSKIYTFLFGHSCKQYKAEDALNGPKPIYLNIKEDTEHGIPKLINYVWLSHVKATEARPINEKFLNCGLKHNLQLLTAESGYKHIIWTDNPEAVQKQIERFGYDVTVNDVAHYSDEFTIFNNYHNRYQNLLKSIDQEENPRARAAMDYEFKRYDLGVEVDLLKYLVVNKVGGIVADLNFDFYSAPASSDLAANDFLYNPSAENSFFGSSPQSVFIKNILANYETILKDRPDCKADGLFEQGFRSPLVQAKGSVCSQDDHCVHYYSFDKTVALEAIGMDATEHSWFSA